MIVYFVRFNKGRDKAENIGRKLSIKGNCLSWCKEWDRKLVVAAVSFLVSEARQ